MSAQTALVLEVPPSRSDWDEAPCALVVVDSSFHVLRGNLLFGSLVGTSACETIGLRFSETLTTASRIYFESVLIPLLHIEGTCREVALTLQGKCEPVPVLVNISGRINEGTRLYDLAVFPASARRTFEEQLIALRHQSERRASWLAQLESLSGVGAWTFEIRSRHMLLSERAYDICGFPRNTIITLDKALEQFSSDVREAIGAVIEKPELCLYPLVHEVDYRHPSGQVRRLKIAGQHSASFEGAPVIQGILQDVTDAHNRQVDLWNAAHLDQMTGLGNRYLFNSELIRRIEVAEELGAFDLLVLDLDGFKAVNDRFGHQAGDEVLRAMGRRISQLDAAMGFRLGGDEFAIILEYNEQGSNADDLSRRLLAEISRPINIGNLEVSVRASIGISTYPNDGDGSDAILHAADCAMYAAKKAGKNNYARYHAQR